MEETTPIFFCSYYTQWYARSVIITCWTHAYRLLKRRSRREIDASTLWKWAYASRYDMMVTVSSGRIRLVVESYGSLGGGGTLFGRVLGYFLS